MDINSRQVGTLEARHRGVLLHYFWKGHSTLQKWKTTNFHKRYFPLLLRLLLGFSIFIYFHLLCDTMHEIISFPLFPSFPSFLSFPSFPSFPSFLSRLVSLFQSIHFLPFYLSLTHNEGDCFVIPVDFEGYWETQEDVAKFYCATEPTKAKL